MENTWMAALGSLDDLSDEDSNSVHVLSGNERMDNFHNPRYLYIRFHVFYQRANDSDSSDLII